MNEKIVSIEWHCLNLEQLIFVEAVIMPEIREVLEKYIDELSIVGVAND